MAFLLPALALLFVLAYFFRPGRRPDAAWVRYQQRMKQRRKRPRSDEPINPDFQFDPPPAEIVEEHLGPPGTP